MNANLFWLDFTVLSLIPFSILLPLLRRQLSSLLLFATLVSSTINWFSSLLLFSLSWKFLWISWKLVDFSSGGFSREFAFPTDSVSSFLATLLSILYSMRVSILSFCEFLLIYYSGLETKIQRASYKEMRFHGNQQSNLMKT